jgi:glycosyltransferase involved in cell wall biosynthesis
MNLWIVSLFDPTIDDKTRPMRFTNLSISALNNGVNTTVFSNNFRHSTKEYRFKKSKEIIRNDRFKTVYIHTTSYNKNISIGRFVSHLVYAWNFRRYLKKGIEHPNYVVSALPPIWLNVYLAYWCKRRGIPFVIDIIDPWPDVFLRYLPKQLQPFNGLIKVLIFPQKLGLKFILANATKLVAISNEYLVWASRLIEPKIKPSQVFYPGVNIREYRNVNVVRSNIEVTNIARPINLIYAGNLGITYDIPCILEAAKKLQKDFPDRFHFRIAGNGHYRDLIETESRNNPSIEYLGRLEFSDLLSVYSKSHLGLAQYHLNATQSVTYKFFDYLAAGLPILNSLQSEMSVLIQENELGINNLSGDSDELARNISTFLDNQKLQKYSQNSLRFAEKFGNNEIVYSDYLKFLAT